MASSCETIEEVVKKMIKDNIGSIVIMDRGIPKGIITERDIVRNIFKVNPDTKAKDIMSSPITMLSHII